jgi:hypothetical protein
MIDTKTGRRRRKSREQNIEKKRKTLLRLA